MNRPPTPVEFDTSNRPSMGDPEVVDGIVRQLAHDVSDALLAAKDGSNPQIAIKALAEKYRDIFYAGNTSYVQTLSPEAQMVWLQRHDIGTDETDPRQVAGCLAVVTIERLSSAIIDHAEEQIDDDQLQFRLDTAIEDCVTLLLGIENRAD